MSIQRETDLPQEDLQYPCNRITNTIQTIQNACDVTSVFLEHSVPIKQTNCYEKYNNVINISQFSIEKTINLPPLVNDLQFANLSLSGYNNENNIVYIASGHRLLLWEYGSSKPWTVIDSIIGDIEKVCFVNKIKDVTPECSFGIVVVTATVIHLIGIQMNGDSISSTVFPFSCTVPAQSVIEVVSTNSGRIFVSSTTGFLYEFCYGMNNSFFRLFGGEYYCSLIPQTLVLPGQTSSIRRMCYDPQHESLFLLFEDETICWCLMDDSTGFLHVNHYVKNITETWKHQSSLFNEELTLVDMTLLNPQLAGRTIVVAVTRTGLRFYLYTQDNQLMVGGVEPTVGVQRVECIHSIGKDLLLVSDSTLYAVTAACNHPNFYEEELVTLQPSTRMVLSVHEVAHGEWNSTSVSKTGCNLQLCGLDCFVDFQEPRFLVIVQGQLLEIRKRRECELIHALFQTDLATVASFARECDEQLFVTKVLHSLCSTDMPESLERCYLEFLLSKDLSVLDHSLLQCLTYCMVPLQDATLFTRYPLQNTCQYLHRLIRFCQTSLQCKQLIEDIEQLTPVYRSIHNSYFFAIRLLAVCNLITWCRTHQVNGVLQDHADFFAPHTLFTLVSEKEWILHLRKLVSQVMQTLLTNQSFMSLCVEASEQLFNLFPVSERLFLESVFLLSQPASTIHSQQIKEKLSLLFESVLDYEVMDYLERILALEQLPLASRVEVVLRGIPVILAVNCSRCGVDDSLQSQHNREAIIEKAEQRLLPFLQQALNTDPSVLPVVNTYASPALSALLIKQCVETENSQLLKNMDYGTTEAFLQKTSHAFLHRFYLDHEEYLKAASFYYTLCMEDQSIPLQQKKALLLECVNDIECLEKAGQFIQLPSHLQITQLRSLLRIISNQLQMDETSSIICSRDSLIQLFEMNHRYDLYITFLKEEGCDAETMKQVWSQYLAYLYSTQNLASLQQVLLTLNDASNVPLYQIFQYCFERDVDAAFATLRFCHANAIGSSHELRLILQGLIEEDRSEESKLRLAELVVEYCEIRVTEDLRALIRVLLSDLLGVVVNREKGEMLIEKLKQFIWSIC